MADPFIGEIRLISFFNAPNGWALCNGQLLPINQNQALFSLLGTMYGGNGQTTFALPDFRGRVPIHKGAGLTQGEAAGSSTVTLSVAQLPAHSHPVAAASNTAGLAASTGNAPGVSGLSPYHGTVNGAMHASSLTFTGGSQSHTNMQPYLAIGFMIATIGIFPSRS